MIKKSRFVFENNETPHAGCFLLSDPFEGNAYFERSVVYLCQFDDDSVFGFVLNNPLNRSLGDVLEPSQFSSHPLHVGGPVAKNQLFFLHRIGYKIPHSFPCGNGIFFSGDFDALTEYHQQTPIPKSELRFFVGYSGWDKGQLEKEIENRSWIAVSNLSVDYVFQRETHNLWKECMDAQGYKFKIIARFPKNPSDN